MADQQNGLWWKVADYAAYAAAAIATAIVGWGWSVLNRYIARIEHLESGCESMRHTLDEHDMRMNTLAEAVDTLVEDSSELKHDQQEMHVMVAEIKNDVKWICQELRK